MSLKIKVKKHGDVPVIAITGEALGKEVAKVGEKINDIMDTGAAVIVIDCSELYSIDSHGLGMFVFSWKMLNAQQKRLVFLNPSEFIQNLFEGSNLNKVFTIINTLEEL